MVRFDGFIITFLVPKLQFGNAYCQAPLGVSINKTGSSLCKRQAELEGRHSQARAWERDIEHKWAQVKWARQIRARLM